MNKYIIHFSQHFNPTIELPGWTVVENPDENTVFGKANEMFKGTLVVILMLSTKEQALVLSSARGLLEVAETVKIVKVSPPGDIHPQILDSTPAIPQTLLNMGDDEFEAITSDNKKRVIHPSQDYTEGTLYYGSTLNGIDMLVTSKKEILSLAGAAHRDISLINNELAMSNFRHETVIDYFSGGVNSDPDELFNKIRAYIQKHIYFPENEIYDLIPIWIMGSYIYRAFRYYPYLHLNAEKGSGKTLLMELIQPVAFNGVLMSQPVPATLLKLIELSGPTLLIDEAEGLAQHGSSGKSQIKQILKTGFARSGQYYIGKTMYRTYGPKCFAGINDLDDVLADRSITIKMLRKTAAERVEVYRETPTIRKDQMLMRDQLYLFGLQYGPNIAIQYEEERPNYDRLIHLTNRAYDVWVPLYRIASAIRSEDLKSSIFNSLDKISQSDKKRRQSRDIEDNETSNLVSGISSIIKNIRPYSEEDGVKYYEPDILIAALIKEEFIPQKMGRKTFSRLIKRVLEIDSVPRGYNLTTKRMYAIDVKKFEEYEKRYIENNQE